MWCTPVVGISIASSILDLRRVVSEAFTLTATRSTGAGPVEPGEGERTAAAWDEGFEEFKGFKGFKGFKEFERLRSRGG
jgi:hypothetical protein